MNYSIEEIEFASPEYDESVSLRYDVLRKPLGLDFTEEQLASEYDSIHLACYDEQRRLLGILLLTPKSDTEIKMRQVAVHADHQNKGIGKIMVDFAEQLAIYKGYDKMVLNARDVAKPFYEKLSYNIEGDEFVEVGIPHYFMWKAIK